MGNENIEVIWKAIAALLLLFQAGCATTQPQVIAPRPPSILYADKVGTLPKIGDLSHAPVGGVMFSQFKYRIKSTTQDANFETIAEGDLSLGFQLGSLSVSVGDQFSESLLNGETVYCTKRLAYRDPLVGPWRAACFVDRNKDRKFELVKVAPGAIYFEKAIDPPLPYRIVKTSEPKNGEETIVPSDDSFKFELLYQGVSRNSLKLAYREYLKDLARPAFYQDVVYDLEKSPTVITFRSVRIEVTSADNNQIAYRVLSAF